MRVAIGADHAGFHLKEDVAKALRKLGQDVLDLGTYRAEPSDDYPDFARAVGQAIVDGQADRGILICGSGVGVSVAANKIPGIRAAICHDTYSAHQGVEHDDMNVLVLGSRIIGTELAHELVRAFLGAQFTGEERHLRRLAKVKAIEDQFLRTE
ncbi:MAG: ribose 5-phosphate isomerase B [Acidobacteria bacterium]|nr:ribose 5-phosphate isomerase B [Acidobacteriota bacterium]